MVRILMVGSRGSNNEVVVEALKDRGFHVEFSEKVKAPNPLKLRKYDVIYGAYLQTCSRILAVAQLLGKKTVIHFVGSDAYRYSRENRVRKLFWKRIVYRCDLIFYVSSHLVQLVKRGGAVLPFPIRVDLFKPSKRVPERDVLYYCPGGEENARIYRLEWILNYARKHPQEKITLMGSPAHPAEDKMDLLNIEVIPFIEYEKMGHIYANHKRLIRMTEEDGLPRMIDEAVLSGLDVVFNGKRIEKISRERYPKVFAQRFEEELLKIL